MGMSAPPDSFGRPRTDTADLFAAAVAAATAAAPLPNLGQVQAELVFTVNEESLRALGQAVASVVGNAVAQGFAAGWEHVTGEPFQTPDRSSPAT